MNRVPQPHEEKVGYYFQLETCPGVLETHVFLSFLWSVSCKRPVINVTLITLKIPTKKTRLIGYFPIVLMELFELYTFQVGKNINCKHLCYVLLLSRVTYVTFFMELQIIT